MCAAHQVRQTTLVQRGGEPAIGRPPIADQHAGEVRAQDRGRVVEAAARANGIHRGVRGRKRPEPVQDGVDAPPGFIRADHRTATDLGTQGRVARGGHAGRAMQRLHETARGDRQPEALPQQRRDLLQRDADVLMQEHNEGHGPRPQVHIGGPHRVGGLQRVPALDATTTRHTPAHLHVEAPDDRPDDREVFLILRCDAVQLDGAPAARAHGRQRRVVGEVDVSGNRAPGAGTIPSPGPSPPGQPAALRPIFGKRGRLSEPRASRGIEVALQALVLPLQPITLTRHPRQLIAHACEFFGLLLDPRALIVGRTRPLIGHTRFMADSGKKYKCKSVRLALSPAK